MKKKIKIIVETDADNERITDFFMPFIEKNFKNYKTAEIEIIEEKETKKFENE